jgi:urease accessory protein
MTPPGRRATAALAAVLFALPVLASAHTPIEGVGDFYGGMLHPLVVPTHLLLLIGLGLLIGQNGIRHAESALPSFGLGLMLGLSSAGLGYNDPMPAPLLLAAAVVPGLLLAASWSLPVASLAVGATAVGLLVGMDSAPETVPVRDRAMALAGVALTALLLVLYLLGATAWLTRPWQRIGLRIVGSWIAAISILSMAFAAARSDSADLAGKLGEPAPPGVRKASAAPFDCGSFVDGTA